MQLRYVTGLEVVSLSAYMESLTPLPEPVEQPLDDHFTVYCRMNNGSRALVRATQIGVGHKNDLRIEVNGELGSIRWAQEESEKLEVYLIDQPKGPIIAVALSQTTDFSEISPKSCWTSPPFHGGIRKDFTMLSPVCIAILKRMYALFKKASTSQEMVPVRDRRRWGCGNAIRQESC